MGRVQVVRARHRDWLAPRRLAAEREVVKLEFVVSLPTRSKIMRRGGAKWLKSGGAGIPRVRQGIGGTRVKERGLTPKQARFVDEYLKDLNATQAAIRAGYSAKTAEQQGRACWVMLGSPLRSPSA